MDEQEPRPWYAPGLLRRIQENRRWLPRPQRRKSLRERLRERGLRLSIELMLGVFFAIVGAAFAAFAVAAIAFSSSGRPSTQAVGPPPTQPPPTPRCTTVYNGVMRTVCH